MPSWRWPGGRGPVLASLTGSQASRLGKFKSITPSVSVGMTHPLPQLFSFEQLLLGHIHEDYIKTENEFPRACPICDDNHFMCKRSARGGTGERGVVDFASRPWSCDQCMRWFHLGCLGVKYVEDVPVKPFLHCKECRDMYVKIETAARKGEQQSPDLFAAAGYSWSLVTEMDHQRLLADGAAGTLPGGRHRRRRRQPDRKPGVAAVGSGSAGSESGDASGSGGVGAADPDDYASRMLSVYTVLASAFSPEVLDTLAEASTEYEGGKYAMLLRHRGQPVSATTFNVYGTELAQISLLATDEEQRLKGHGRAMLAVLENFFDDLGVKNVSLQPRSDTLDLWVQKFGFRVLHPQDVWLLYQQAPLPHYDCAVLCKSLEAEASTES